MKTLTQLVLLALTTGSWLGAGCLVDPGQPQPVSKPPVPSARTQESPRPSAIPPRPPLAGSSLEGRETALRVLSQPFRWNGNPIGPFAVDQDREAAKLRSLARRAQLRSFDGAPPLMPHSAEFGEGSKACLDCHRDGMRIGDRVAHPASHSPLPNCMQCHIESVQRELPPARPIESQFEGWRAARASRDRRGATPPVIPHAVRLRNRCLACHGEYGWPGLRTTHPERAMCMQCHVESGSR